MSLVIDRGGTSLDHIALCVPDTRKGVAEVAELTGFKPTLRDPNPDTFYWSGALPLGHDRFLEVLGPNPLYRSFNPFIETVKRLDRPRPLFWYVATGDFVAFEKAAADAGAPVERVVEQEARYEDLHISFKRGIIGPGFLSVCPNVIEWRARTSLLSEQPGPVYQGLDLWHPEADRLNSVFSTLGIEQKVQAGEHYMKLRLGTPKGDVSFEGEGLQIRGAGMWLQFAALYARWLLHRTG
ncbi:MAG: VOC family protein [Pseudomonadota bacterium]